MAFRSTSLLMTVLLIAAGCSEGGERPTLTDATVAPDVEVAGITEERSSVPPTTSEASADTTLPPSSTTSTSTSTTIADDGPPPAPGSVRCGPGVGSGELTLSWDAPSEDDDVVAYRAYVASEDGRFVQRANVSVADAAAAGEADRHGMTVPDVPEATAISVAVTAFDSVGNESGWNPIDAWIAGAGAPCNTGAPPAVAGASVSRGAGSGEVTVTFAPTAADVASYDATVTQPGVEGPHGVSASLAEGGSVLMVIGGIDYDAPFSLSITATDHHGNTSSVTPVSCTALPAGGVC